MRLIGKGLVHACRSSKAPGFGAPETGLKPITPPKSRWGTRVPRSRFRHVYSVVHSVSQFLFAAEIPLGRLNRNMTE